MSQITTGPTNPMPPAVTSRRLEETAARHGSQIALGLFVLAVLLAIYPVYYLTRHGFEAVPPAFWWLAVLSADALAVAVINVVYSPRGRMSPGEKLRFIIVLLGGLIGICTAIFGLALPLSEYRDVFSGGFAEWRKNPAALAWTALPLFGGLILTFVSLLLTAGLERSSALARRVLYGYNAVLSGLLLLFIFLLLNVLPYSGVWPFRALAQTADWTTSGLYTLSQATKERLASINRPVKVYVLLTGMDPFNNDVETMLQNCREINSRISWETLSRDLNRKKVGELVDRYQLADPTGLIVVYGTEPNDTFQFIPRRDLGTDMSTEDTVRYAFKGEGALLNALTFLSEGKTKAVVYFTQGHGELDINERGTDRPDVGAAQAMDSLGKVSYEVKPLTFDIESPKVPDDAAVVIIARPRMKFGAKEIDALRAYMNGDGKKKGKLFLLFDVIAQQDGTMLQTGLESFVGGYDVAVGNDRILRADPDVQDPSDVIVFANPRSSNTIARAFTTESGRMMAFVFNDVRPVRPAAPPEAGAPNPYTAQELFITFPVNQYLWIEPDLRTSPEVLAAALRKSREQVTKKILRSPVSVAVAVSEGAGAAPQIPGHDFMRESQPRMLVFGDSTWVANRDMEGKDGQSNRELFVSCVNWLRGRPDIGTQPVEAKTRAEFRLPEHTGYARLLFLPVALILLTVVCMGMGVWVVRRR
jgi:hypothetical protein